MTEKLELYKCEICGNMVEVVLSGVGELVCCGEPMEKLKPKTDELDPALKEKHIPVVNRLDDGIEVVVGSNLHPMEENHYIQFVEITSPDKKSVTRKYFEPHEMPILEYKCKCPTPTATEYCNIHGLFESM